jgi:FkbM family methyltransferase
MIGENSLKILYYILKIIYQPFKILAKFFGITLIAKVIEEEEQQPNPSELYIPYNKNDLKIFYSLLEKINQECQEKINDVTFDTFDLIINYDKYVDKISDAFNLLADDFSKELYFELIKFRLICDFKSINSRISPSITLEKPKYPVPKLHANAMKSKRVPFLFRKNKTIPLPTPILSVFYHSQYELPGIVEVEPGDIVFDVGGYNGDTACYFDSAVSTNGKVYVFEPNKRVVEILKFNIQLNNRRNIIVIEKGLSDNISTVKFISSEGQSKVLKENYSDVEKFNETQYPVPSTQYPVPSTQYPVPSTQYPVPSTQYPVPSTQYPDVIDVDLTTIDDFVREENIRTVNFIKMDIEGHESAAINGAKKTLISKKPKLAISIYHSAHDLFQLPLLIHSINPEYKLFIRHPTTNCCETILFCK